MTRPAGFPPRGIPVWLLAASLAAGPLALPSCSTPAAAPPAGARKVAASDPERIQRILQRLLPFAPGVSCPGFVIIPSSVPNASINPRGVIHLTTGLLELAGSDDLLAFALAHELAHAALGHPGKILRLSWLQAAASGAVLWAAREAAGDHQEAAWAGAGFFLTTSLLGTLPALRRLETESDLAARAMITRAGYRPEAAAAFWERYGRARPERALPAWLTRHPSDASRARRLAEP